MLYGFQFDDTPGLLEAMPETKVTRRRRKGCMTSGMCCIRTTLISFNLATGLAGVCLLAAGLMLFVKSTSGNLSGIALLDEILQTDDSSNYGEFRTFSILCMIVGGLIGVISFVGCFGACVNSRCLLMTYLISVVITVMLQLFVSVFAIIYRQPVSNSIRQELLDTVQNYEERNNTLITWDKVHIKFDCCGVDGFSDWFTNDKRIVPDSCCEDVQPDCGKTLEPPRWRKKGCLAKIQYYVLERLHIMAFAIIGVVFLQLYGIIASTLLFCHIRTPKIPHAFQDYRYERAKM